jgi:hypothetical protein
MCSRPISWLLAQAFRLSGSAELAALVRTTAVATRVQVGRIYKLGCSTGIPSHRGCFSSLLLQLLQNCHYKARALTHVDCRLVFMTMCFRKQGVSPSTCAAIQVCHHTQISATPVPWSPKN